MPCTSAVTLLAGIDSAVFGASPYAHMDESLAGPMAPISVVILVALDVDGCHERRDSLCASPPRILCRALGVVSIQSLVPVECGRRSVRIRRCMVSADVQVHNASCQVCAAVIDTLLTATAAAVVSMWFVPPDERKCRQVRSLFVLLVVAACILRFCWVADRQYIQDRLPGADGSRMIRVVDPSGAESEAGNAAEDDPPDAQELEMQQWLSQLMCNKAAYHKSQASVTAELKQWKSSPWVPQDVRYVLMGPSNGIVLIVSMHHSCKHM